MMKRVLRTCAVCMMILALSGCGTGKQQIMKLSLNSNPTTGYTWTVTQDPEADSTVVSYTVEVSRDMKIKVTASRFAGGYDINVLPQVPEPEIK